MGSKKVNKPAQMGGVAFLSNVKRRLKGYDRLGWVSEYVYSCSRQITEKKKESKKKKDRVSRKEEKGIK